MSRSLQKQIPNSLTVIRLFLAAGFFVAMNLYRYPDIGTAWANAAIGFFIAAAITDALDGWLARKWNVESVFGRVMDPFCDKVLIIGAFIYLAGPRFFVESHDPIAGSSLSSATAVYPWMVVVILARELLVTGIRGIVESEGVKFGSLWSGKSKMILQCTVVPIVLFLAVNFKTLSHTWALRICEVLVYVTLVVTVWSGVPYIWSLRTIAVSRTERGSDES